MTTNRLHLQKKKKSLLQKEKTLSQFHDWLNLMNFSVSESVLDSEHTDINDKHKDTQVPPLS